LLRENLSAATHKLIVRTIDKNLVQHSEAEIRAHLESRECG
jgi:protein required for attachment to host cells